MGAPVPRTTVAWCELPFESVQSIRTLSCGAYCVIALVRSEALETEWPSTAVIRSPCWIPAEAAPEPDWTPWTRAPSPDCDPLSLFPLPLPLSPNGLLKPLPKPLPFPNPLPLLLLLLLLDESWTLTPRRARPEPRWMLVPPSPEVI